MSFSTVLFKNSLENINTSIYKVIIRYPSCPPSMPPGYGVPPVHNGAPLWACQAGLWSSLLENIVFQALIV